MFSLCKKIWPVLALVGCGHVSIKSTPSDAEIGVLLPGQDTPKIIGKTPYQSNLSELSSIVNEGTILVVVRKDGFVTQNIMVPNLGSGKLDLSVNLVPYVPPNYEVINRIVTMTLKAERHILEKQYEEALKVASEILALNENVTSAYEIRGAVYFLQKDLTKSRLEWKRAVELDPNNADAQNMLAQIERSLGNVTN